jgi:hypothetical protein
MEANLDVRDDGRGCLREVQPSGCTSPISVRLRAHGCTIYPLALTT